MDEQITSKITFSLKPPLPNNKNLLSPRSPTMHPSLSDTQMIRRNSNIKAPHKRSTQKSIRQIQIQKNIKYSRPKPQIKQEISFIQSQNRSAAIQGHLQLQATQESISKNITQSHEKMRRQSTQKQIRLLDSLSGVSSPNTNRRSGQKNEEYYVYWKNKAHQYLQANMKLTENISKLARENQTLKQAIDLLKCKQSLKNIDKINNRIDQNKSMVDFRPMSLYYLTKIEQLQKQVKKKDNMLQITQIKISELNQVIVGDKERIKLISILKTEIQALKLQNSTLLQSSKAFRIHQSNQTTSESFLSPRKTSIPFQRRPF